MQHLETHPTSAQNKIIKTPSTPMDESSQRNLIRIGVVPEHFSTPFHIGSEHNVFSRYGLNADVIENPRGTGSMCKALRENKLDVAIALTEGLVSDIAKNPKEDVFRICGTYVQSPLVWAVVTKANSSHHIETLSYLNGKNIGISRFGSGSHIMSFLLAERENWYREEKEEEQQETREFNRTEDHSLTIHFVSCGGLDDLREGIRSEKIDCFLWETFMLKHLIDKGELKKVGEIVTPWPCFMIAVRNEFVERNVDSLEKLFDAIRECCQLFYQNKQQSLEFISNACHLSLEDAEKWFRAVEFAKDPRQVSEKMLMETIDILKRTKVLKGNIDVSNIYNSKFVHLTRNE